MSEVNDHVDTASAPDPLALARRLREAVRPVEGTVADGPLAALLRAAAEALEGLSAPIAYQPVTLSEDGAVALAVRAALLRVAENVAKHCVGRSGWSAHDECFQVDLREAEREIHAALLSRLAAAGAVAEACVAALRPFAEYGQARDAANADHRKGGVMPDAHSVVEWGSVSRGNRGYSITIGHCRAALRAVRAWEGEK